MTLQVRRTNLRGLGNQIRPDAVYRTGVVQPANYDPTTDVGNIVNDFTTQGMAMAQLNGLRGNGLSIWDKLKLRVAAARSRRTVNKMVKRAQKLNGLRGLGDYSPFGYDSGADGLQPYGVAMATGANPNAGITQMPMGPMADRFFANPVPGLVAQGYRGLPDSGPNQIRARAQAAAMRRFTLPTTWKIGQR